MKNKVLLFVLLLSFATGCTFVDTNSPVEPDDTYLSLKSSQIMLPPDQTGDNMESVTIESLRIMVFSKATGKIITNKAFDITNLNLASKDPDTGYWIIDFSDIVVATKPGESIVYVVLNENIMSISGQTLTGALNTITTVAGMQTLVNTPLSYTHPLRVVYGTDGKPIEPPFIMSTFDEFNIPPNKPIDNPYVADLRGLAESNKGFALDRTMAKVTLESISSYPRYAGEITDNKKTSYIFILKAGLVNVPTQYLWSPNRLNTTPPASPPSPSPVLPYSGSFQTLDFGLENATTGYYDRTWNGSIAATATATVVWTQYGTSDRRIYKITKNNGIDSYSTVYNGHLESSPTSNINQGNFKNFFIKYFTEGAGGGTEFNIGDLVFDNKKVVGNITPAYWELNEKNISYYVPEHILSDKTNPANSTKLYVKASIASMPDFDPNTVNFTKDQVNWGTSDNEPNWEYPPLGDMGTLINSSFLAEPVYQNGKLLGYKHSWGGPTFWREAKGTITLDLGNVNFAHIIDSNNIKEFYLPIQNTPTTENPVDYNIYRNHEYKFSVHALEQWAPTARNAVSETVNNRNNTAESIVLRFNDH